ncbi:glycosyltransferase family 2 protein, partial [Paraglaciecola sp.]|uniref:glycosyltransferase family 2 protein n=1 Tax=Paraglaciecola sp. TaxID=1920173 RepID=UPI00273FA05E
MNSHYFNSEWYVQKYPDIAAAGIDPLQHYLNHGQKEGRWPCALPALELEQTLWQAVGAEPYLVQLQQLWQKQQPLHSALAAWVLARWCASVGQWQQALPLLQPLLQDEIALNMLAHQGPFLLAFSTYFNCKQTAQAHAVLSHPLWADTVDKQLARSMLVGGTEKLRLLNKVFASQSLTPLQLNTQANLDSLQAEKMKSAWYRFFRPRNIQPKVSIIVPCFNASKTIATALKSLLRQSHRNIEILVADDCSTDNSVAIVQQFAKQDKRIALVQLTTNSGAYVARNTALQQASGDFITTHDADDWSHPEKIERQVQALQQDATLMASVSHWVRCSPELVFQRWRMEDAWVYRNVSSLMFRKAVFEALGFWDCVSVNADTEYYYRIKQQFGDDSIVEVLPGVPLSFGRADENSLSQTKASHLRTQFRGVRKDYHDAAIAWHKTASSLYLPAMPEQRPFVAPALICRGSENYRQHNVRLILEQKQLFDAAWYLRRYPDIAQAGAEPLAHFIAHGAAEGRDPLPTFSLSSYAYQQKLPITAALAHWLKAEEPEKYAVHIAGEASKLNQPTMMLVGHAVSDKLFGAERSFLDVVKALSQCPFRLIVVLPSAHSAKYITALRQYVDTVVIMPYYWWRAERTDEPAVLEQYTHLFKQYAVKLLYVNTIVLSEPLTAAQSVGIPAVLHVRELLAHDPSLCKVLNIDDAQMRQVLLQRKVSFV